jgi:hypothetical protein
VQNVLVSNSAFCCDFAGELLLVGRGLGFATENDMS